MHIRKRIHAVAAPVHDHLVPDKVRRMIAFTHRHVPAAGAPFMPRERMRIRDVACPDVVERCVTVPTGEEDEVPVGVEDGGVCASRRGARGGYYAGFAPAVGNWDGQAVLVSECRRDFPGGKNVRISSA